jgi:hypothetical protein
VTALSGFGLFAVTAMLIAYALSSLYGFLRGAWPFGLVEAVWALVALRKWSRR